MPDYHALYLQLFRVQADAIEAIGAITEKVVRAHREAEKAVMNSPDLVVRPMPAESPDRE